MVHRGSVGMPGRRAVLLLCVAFIGLLASILIPAAAQAQSKRLLLYTGTTGFRHTDGINGGRPIVQAALRDGRLHGRLGGLHQQRRRSGDQLRQRRQEPAHLHGHEPREVRRDRSPELLVGPARGPLGRRAARRDHQVRPERRRHRRHPQRHRHGHHRHDVGLVGRQQRQLGRRLDDEGPRRDRPEQHRHGPGRGQQPPRHPRPAGHVHVRRRALQLQPQRPRHAPRARQPRRAHLHARRQRDGPGPPGHVVQALRRRQHQRRHRARPRTTATAARG